MSVECQGEAQIGISYSLDKQGLGKPPFKAILEIRCQNRRVNCPLYRERYVWPTTIGSEGNNVEDALLKGSQSWQKLNAKCEQALNPETREERAH